MKLNTIIEAILNSYQKFVEAGTAYLSSIALTLYGTMATVDWKTALASAGGLVLFLARASVDIPKAIDYWKERKKRKKND